MSEAFGHCPRAALKALRSARRARSRRVVSAVAAAAAGFGVAASTAVGVVGPAWAQTPQAPRLENTDDRTGLRVDSFILRPELGVETSYSDNYLQGEDDRLDSLLLTTRPEVSLESDWNRHALTLSAFAEHGYYTEDQDDNYLDLGVAALGILDVTRAAGIRVATALSRLSEGRGSDDTAVGAAEPVEYLFGEIDVEGRYKRGRIRLSPFAAFELRDYEDVDTIGGEVSNQDDRDRIGFGVGGEVGYEFLRGYEAFLRGEALFTEYDDEEDDGGVARSSNGFRVLTGVNLALSRLIEGRVGLGWEQRDFDDDELDTVQGVSVDIGVDWFITPLTTIQFAGEGGVDETTVGGASGTSGLSGTLSVKHALRRDVLVGGFAGFATEEFDGIDRTDDTISAGASVEWLLNSHLSLGARYEFTDETSTVSGESFTENLFSVGLRARY